MYVSIIHVKTPAAEMFITSESQHSR